MHYLKSLNPGILCLQDTHLLSQDEGEIKKNWNGKCIINGSKTNARGVAVLFSNNIEYDIKFIQKDTAGNSIILNLSIFDINVTIINIYAPNNDSLFF